MEEKSWVKRIIMPYFISDNIISSLGFSTEENFNSLLKGEVGIKEIEDTEVYPDKFLASTIDKSRLESEFGKLVAKYSNTKNFTTLEKLIILSIDKSLQNTEVDIKSGKTAIILSTTKGNIDLLDKKRSEKFDKNRDSLWKLGEVIANFFGNPNEVITISNACISGVIAINTAAMYINGKMFDNVVICGGDLVTRFVVSGFMSFLSLSEKPCKPFDKNRNGLSLGEAAGTIILSNLPPKGKQKIKFRGGASANDANHISGPSRTGEGSYISIKKALIEAGIESDKIDHISAHGTATPYNDEMESIAITRHSLQSKPVNSIKGSLGHTLGAAGIIESIILLEEMRNNTLLKTMGFAEIGVSNDINILTENTEKDINTCLKMASGFGGSNAAMIISKE
ncbi:MAG: beta-ketoacyl synthase [Marinilabiliales bacterium]|nr:MAG: beta-ketoacyl synthase [Marinilabiliales bacterium]